ncbi:hypothetical protein JWG45_11200 [Leptospira sp. 201903070]|uniref:Lipoprotein n=1 Tax=Leptospira ainlahdjerensis TaxID=2810033 RepID=A0ABS2UDV9_9LEPT|nr:hypothetical protein [Leptospira ainlahdjerensis]MBM9577702.1 hypothetical protein [Leptospira ainlahdjerensis]MBM9577718.1 hypothetical protein [Leptospira ainlahdjerensis]
MLLKKTISLILLTFLFSYCDGKSGNDDSMKNFALLMALTSPKDQGVSGLYSALNLRDTGNGGGAGAYSNGAVSPLAVVSQSMKCPKGGSMDLSGDVVITPVGAGVITMQLNGAKSIYTSCSFSAPALDGSSNSNVSVLLEGELLQDATMTQTTDPTSTTSLYKVSASGTQRIRSSNYKVNGFLYPTFDVTFTRNNAKLSIENANDIDKAVVNIDETVRVTGTVGTETVDSTYSYKGSYKLK